MRIIEFFDKGAAIDPDRPCLVDDTGTYSYRQVQARTHRIANACARDGILPGTKAAVYSGNSALAFECILGFLRAGCVWTTVNARNRIDETVHILNNTDTDMLFYSVEFRDQAAEVLARCPRVRRAVCLDAVDGDHPCLEDWVAGLPEESQEVLRERDDIEVMLSSGGTTGLPKGVPMTQLNWEMMTAITYHLLLTEHPMHLMFAPMTHAAGGLAMMLMPMGATHVILPGFDAQRIMECIEEYRITHLFMPPTAIYMLLAHPDVRRCDYSSLRHLVYASAPMAVEKIKEAVDVFGPVLAQSYGQTETGVKITYFSAAEHARAIDAGDDRRLASCGRETLFARVAIMDDAGNLLPPDTPGEVVVRALSVTPGYYKDPEETARAQVYGWQHTGDIGMKDAEGWLTIIDRKKDMVISGGFNIYPREIENVLLGHADVQDCAVIGVPDEKWGEALKAIVQLKPGVVFDARDLDGYCRRLLSNYKVPKTFEYRDDLPRSPAGKILKRVLREPYWAGSARKVG